MKHIRNSVKGVFFLEHQGVPTATLTDFNEVIKDGSLCVDRNNHDLYILKNGVWTLFTSGISTGDFIPRAGTDIGLPVTGNIEMQDGVSIERGSSQITFKNDALIFHFSDNDGNPADDCGVTMNRNIVFQLDSAITSIDANSKGNFVYKVKDNFQLFNSNDNTIFTKADNLFLDDVQNTTILNNVKNTNINNLDNSMIEGNFDGLTIDGTAGALFASYGDSENLFLKGTSVVSKPYYFSYTNSFKGAYGIYLEGLMAYMNIQNCTSMYGKGVMAYSAKDDTHFHTYGKWAAVTSDNDGVYSLGKTEFAVYINNSNDISVLGKLTNSTINTSSYITHLGYISGVNVTGTTESLFLNNVNTYDVNAKYSRHLIIANNNNQIAESDIISTEDLIAFSNQSINSTSSINNILINTKDITLENSYNNFIIGDGRKEDSINKNGFTGSVGSNNALFGLESTSSAVFTVGDYNFAFGDIISDTNQDLKSGNILLGNNTINSTLTDNNIILSAKRVSNINHDNRGNNVFLNVGNFNVPDIDTLYVPCKFYAVASADNFGIFDACNITSTQTWTLPDKTGTVALLSDITGDSSTSGVKFINDLYDVNTTNIINGEFLSYDLESTSWVNKGIYVETTYAELETLVGTNGLSPNVLYAFDYQTIHNIPANTGGLSGYHEGQYNDTTDKFVENSGFTQTTFTPETEKLIIRAVSGTSFAIEVTSLSHPEDKLEYNFFDNLSEDGLRSRTGKITFRHDTKRNLSTHYDFRNVIFRRYRNLASDISGVPNYFNDTGCSLEQVCVSSVPNTPMETLYNKTIEYTDYYTPDGVVRYYPTLENRLPREIPTSSTAFISGILDDFTQVGYFETFNDGLPYNDYLTFSNDNFQKTKFSNIHIGKMNFTNSTIAKTENMIKIDDTYALGIRENIIDIKSPELGKHYSDVVFFPNNNAYISNINIGENTYGVTLNSDANFINIGDGCSNITFGASFNILSASANQNINIGNFNRNIHIHRDINSIEIGNANKNIVLVGGASRDVKIGNYNQQIYANDLQFVTIGDSNLRNVISGDIKYVTMGDNNQDNHIINCVYNFSMGDNNYENVVKFMLNGSFKSNNVRNNVFDSRWVDFGINVRDSYIVTSWFVEIDELNQFEIVPFDGTAGNTIINSKYVNIGKESYFNSISDSIKVDIGYRSRNNEVNGNSNYIGDSCSTNKIIGNDNYIGHESNTNFIITNSNNNKLGMFTNGNIINHADNNFIDDYSIGNVLKGNSNDNIIGKDSNSNFFEDSSHNIIGDKSNTNIFNTTNIKYILFVDSTLNYALDGNRTSDKSIRDANTANQASNISTIIGGSFSNIGSHYNKIGNESSNNHFISSSHNQVGHDSNNNRFGGEVNETFANTSGCGAGGNEVCPIVGSDATILSNKLDIVGELSNKNIIGNNSSYNEFVGGYGETSGLVTTQYFSDPAVDSAFENNYNTIHSQIGNIPFTYVNDFDGLFLGGGYPGDARTRFFSLGHSYNRVGDNTDRIKFNGSNGSYYNSIISTSNEMIISGTLNNVSVVINGEWEQRVAYNYDPSGISYTGFKYVDSPTNLPSVYAGTDFVTGNYSNISVSLRDTVDNSLWYQDITGGALNTPNQFN
jgi:hypothetical protein